MLRVTTTSPKPPLASTDSPQIEPLDNGHKAEVLSFLSARPLRTFIKTGWIRDNGLVSPFNRGTFYGNRDAKGRLEGVALIGHITLFEAPTDAALAAFAKLAQLAPSTQVILGAQTKINRFMVLYLKGGLPPRTRLPRVIAGEAYRGEPQYLVVVATRQPRAVGVGRFDSRTDRIRTQWNKSAGRGSLRFP